MALVGSIARASKDVYRVPFWGGVHLQPGMWGRGRVGFLALRLGFGGWRV